jgi:hypothetical protein
MTIGAITSPPPARVADAGADVTGAAEEQAQASLLLQRQRFDLAAEERSELVREQDAMRDLMMAELKSEDAYVKKWIELI